MRKFILKIFKRIFPFERGLSGKLRKSQSVALSSFILFILPFSLKCKTNNELHYIAFRSNRVKNPKWTICPRQPSNIQLDFNIKINEHNEHGKQTKAMRRSRWRSKKWRERLHLHTGTYMYTHIQTHRHTQAHRHTHPYTEEQQQQRQKLMKMARHSLCFNCDHWCKFPFSPAFHPPQRGMQQEQNIFFQVPFNLNKRLANFHNPGSSD